MHELRDKLDSMWPVRLFPRLESRPLTKLSDGSTYLGEWIVGTETRQGEGVATWRDGDIYEGQWRANRRHGFGKFTAPR